MGEGEEEAESTEEEHGAPQGSGGAAWHSLPPPPVPRASRPAETGCCVLGVPGPLTAPPLSPPVHGIKWTCSNGNSSSGFSVEQLVQQILDSHQTKPPPRTHNCLCTGSLGERGPGQAGAWRGRGCSARQRARLCLSGVVRISREGRGGEESGSSVAPRTASPLSCRTFGQERATP